MTGTWLFLSYVILGVLDASDKGTIVQTHSN